MTDAELAIVFAGSEDREAEQEWQDRMVDADDIDLGLPSPWDEDHPAVRAAEQNDAQANYEKNES